MRKLQSFRDMLVVASDRWRRTRNRRTYANLPTTACALAISSISGVGKSLRALAAQFLGASFAARPSGGAYPPAGLAKECVRWIEADQPQSAFKVDPLTLNGRRYLPHLRSPIPSLRDARSCSDGRRPERGGLSTSHAWRTYSEYRAV
jgi:hypothetical protein